MVRRYGVFLVCVFVLFSAQNAVAAMSPENQQYAEESKVRESAELQGKTIYSITQYEDGDTTFYKVEADCTYTFEVDYSLNWLVLFGWVGAQQFEVDLVDEPECTKPPTLPMEQADFRDLIVGSVAVVYAYPASMIDDTTSLFPIPKAPALPRMDFSIFMLREFLKDRIGCDIPHETFMKSRTVGDLVGVSTASCN